jgi:hypothetical protein
MVNPLNMFKASPIPRGGKSELGKAGYDNPRENIDPHVKTKVLDTKELVQNGISYDLSTMSGGATYDDTSLSGMVISLSGAHANTRADLISLSGAFWTLSGANSAEHTGLTNQITSLSGQHVITRQFITSLSGEHLLTRNSLNNLSGLHVALSGANATAHETFVTKALSGSHVHNDYNFSGAFWTLSGANGAAHTDLSNKITSLSGQHVTTRDWITSLSGQHLATKNSLANLSGLHVSLSGAYYAHAADNSDPHGANLIQTGTMSGGRLIVTSDWEVMSGAYVANIIYGLGATPPTASNFTRGSVYLQYTA